MPEKSCSDLILELAEKVRTQAKQEYVLSMINELSEILESHHLEVQAGEIKGLEKAAQISRNLGV